MQGCPITCPGYSKSAGYHGNKENFERMGFDAVGIDNSLKNHVVNKLDNHHNNDDHDHQRQGHSCKAGIQIVGQCDDQSKQRTDPWPNVWDDIDQSGEDPNHNSMGKTQPDDREAQGGYDHDSQHLKQHTDHIPL